MSENDKKRRGRPREKGSMHTQYRLMMSDDMARRLDNLSQMTGKSRADIFREAFNIYENLEKTKHEDADLDVEEIYFDEDEDDFNEDFD